MVDVGCETSEGSGRGKGLGAAGGKARDWRLRTAVQFNERVRGSRWAVDVVKESWYGTDRPFRRLSGAGSEPVEFRSRCQAWGHLGAPITQCHPMNNGCVCKRALAVLQEPHGACC